MQYMKDDKALFPDVHYGVAFATLEREPEGKFQQALKALGVHLRIFTTEVKDNWTQYAGYVETPMPDVTPAMLKQTLNVLALVVSSTPVDSTLELVLDAGDLAGPSIHPVRYLANEDVLAPYSTWIALTTWKPEPIPTVSAVAARLSALNVVLSQPENARVRTTGEYPFLMYLISTTDKTVSPSEVNEVVQGAVTLVVSEPITQGMSSEALWKSHSVRDQLLEITDDLVDYNVALTKKIIPGGSPEDPWDVFDWLKLGAGVFVVGGALYYGSKLYKELKGKPRKVYT